MKYINSVIFRIYRPNMFEISIYKLKRILYIFNACALCYMCLWRSRFIYRNKRIIINIVLWVFIHVSFHKLYRCSHQLNKIQSKHFPWVFHQWKLSTQTHSIRRNHFRFIQVFFTFVQYTLNFALSTGVDTILSNERNIVRHSFTCCIYL